jgi:hypothetical protein
VLPSETACPDFAPDRQSRIHKKLLLLNSGQAQVSKSKVFVPHLPLLGIAETVSL